MNPPDKPRRLPTYDEIAADVADAAVGTKSISMRRLIARTFWWLAHHIVARPLAIALPFRPVFRFSAWTLDRRNM